MFLHLGVIVLTGGRGSAQPPCRQTWGIWADLPGCRPPPLDAEPLDADPLGRTCWMQTPPSIRIHQQMGGTHPTGMHTCCWLVRVSLFIDLGFP